jgi:hypothetical protein
MIRAETLPDEKREAILKALGRFPQYLVLWKWENETLPNQPDNVFVRKWMPQREILCKCILVKSLRILYNTKNSNKFCIRNLSE